VILHYGPGNIGQKMNLSKTHKTKTDLVYEVLKKSILDGKWKPHQRLNSNQIARDLGVSRTPVIEASRILQMEGILSILPQIGLEVKELSPSEIEEIFFIRGALGGVAAAQACRYIKERRIEDLERILVEMEKALKKKDYRKFSALNKRFHWIIYEACNLPNLIELVERYWNNGDRYARFFKCFPETLSSLLKNHYEMLEAFKFRDFERARKAVEKDSTDFGHALAEFIRESGGKSD
jgi:DNA-binding GntR family transcriptional regulator